MSVKLKKGKGGKRNGSGRKRLLQSDVSVVIGTRVPSSLVPVFKQRVKVLVSKLVEEAKLSLFS